MIANVKSLEVRQSIQKWNVFDEGKSTATKVQMVNFFKGFGTLLPTVEEDCPLTCLICELTVDDFESGH